MAGASGVSVRLPPNLDTAVAAALARQLKDARGRPLSLDASGVERLGGLCLQVLLTARRAWADDGQAFAFTAPSPAFRAALALCGAQLALSGAQALEA